MDEADVVRALWDRIQARDWSGLAELLDDELVVEWPSTGERFVGPANFVAVQSEYPEGWSIDVLRVVADSAGPDSEGPDGAEVVSEVVSEVEVPHEQFGVFRAASFWTVRDGKILRGREYWTTVGAEEVPDWRVPLGDLP